VDAVSDDRGQAVVLTVFLIAIAAIVIVGLRAQQDHVFALERTRRAGEAAAEAATTAVADAYVVASREASARRLPLDVSRVLSAEGTRDAARGAADEASRVNGGAEIGDVALRCGEGRVEITVLMSGASYRAGFPAGECSRR
jgi:hypothetical protein